MSFDFFNFICENLLSTNCFCLDLSVLGNHLIVAIFPGRNALLFMYLSSVKTGTLISVHGKDMAKN